MGETSSRRRHRRRCLGINLSRGTKGVSYLIPRNPFGASVVILERTALERRIVERKPTPNYTLQNLSFSHFKLKTRPPPGHAVARNPPTVWSDYGDTMKFLIEAISSQIARHTSFFPLLQINHSAASACRFG